MADLLPNGRPADVRGRRIVLAAHCLLNANAKVEGLAEYAGVHPIVGELAARGVGIVQMPCAEFGACGMARWGQVREQYENPAFIGYCESLADDALDLVAEYQRCGYEVLGVVGIDGSPTCGVRRSASGPAWGGEPGAERWAQVVSHAGSSPEPGVHVAALQERLKPLGLRFTAIDESVEGHHVQRALGELGL